MRPHTCLSGAIGLTAGILLGACDSPSRPRETTAPGPVSVPPGDARAYPSRYATGGPYGQLFAVSEAGTTQRQINLSLFATTDDRPYLYYSVWQCDLATFDCQILEEGSGLFPAGDLTSRRGSMSLDTDTSGNPDFELFIGSGGRIRLAWTELSGWSVRSTSQTRYQSANFLAHYHGTFTTSSALAEGSVFGFPVTADASGAQIGTVSEGGVTISR